MKRTQRERNRYWDIWAEWRGADRLRRCRGRPRGMSQRLWFWMTPHRPDRSCPFREGWSGGRDRSKPRKTRYQFVCRGEWLGGLIRYYDDGQWLAYVNVAYAGDIERSFWHRRDAKRWVEAEAARRAR